MEKKMTVLFNNTNLNVQAIITIRDSWLQYVLIYR